MLNHRPMSERAALVVTICKYARRYRPTTRKQILNYIVQRREWPYPDVVAAINELHKRHMLPGVFA